MGAPDGFASASPFDARIFRTADWGAPSTGEISMSVSTKWIAVAISACALIYVAHAQEPAGRQELKRADLTGTNMEVIISVSETRPGETFPRHIHHGEEALYVLEGATAELPDGKQISLATGAAVINARDVPHAGFKIVGDKTLKLLTVHVVDKGKPLYDKPQ
jgi:quercetin dioxygenase-like cupin family protein